MNETAEPKQFSHGRRLAFTAVALAIPVLFFVLAEGLLRLTGAGADYPLFIPHPQHPDYLLANPQVLKRFFGKPEQAPSMQIETVFFRAEKPDNGIRIVVQGGSSAAGFPYGFGASLTGMLEQRLRRVYPGRPIEVINTAMSAVNTYTLLDFADEIIEQQPDAVLVYAGHNEYLGILGVGSAFLGGQSPALTRAYLRLRKLRLFQLLQTVFGGIAPGTTGAPLDAVREQGTMMSRVAAEQHIALGSPLYEKGLAQYRHNLAALVRRYAGAGIPVYIGTLVSNEKGQPPFNSGLGPDTDPDEWAKRYRSVAAGEPALPALPAARALVDFDELSADAWFLLGEAAYASSEWDLARTAYQSARDRDELRFRAPGVFNEIVRDASRLGARVVDVEDAMRREAGNSIFDKTLVLEHVHPTLRGYFLLADSFYDALVADGLPGIPVAPVDDAEAWLEVPVSEVDRLFGEYKVARVTMNWPFTNTPGMPELPDPDSVPAMLAQQLYRQTIDWTAAHRKLAEHYQSVGDTTSYAKVSLILADAFPFNPGALYSAGVALIDIGRQRQALDYLYRSAQLAPTDLNGLLALSHALVLNNARPQARQVLDRVLQLDPDNAVAHRVLDQLASDSDN